MKKTATEAELREWVKQGLTYGEIGKRLGRASSSVGNACACLGISPKAHKPKLPMADYLACLRIGMSVQEIATKHGLSQPSVSQALKRAGLPTSARALLKAEASGSRITA